MVNSFLATNKTDEQAVSVIWERQPGEPPRWFARFCAFLALGPSRSLNAVARAEMDGASKGAERRAAGAWQRAAHAWRWKERAEAWDADRLERERDELEKERREERKARRALLRTARQKIERELATLAPESFREVISALRVVAEQQRIEYGETASDASKDGAPLRVIYLPQLEEAPQ